MCCCPSKSCCICMIILLVLVAVGMVFGFGVYTRGFHKLTSSAHYSAGGGGAVPGSFRVYHHLTPSPY